MTNSDYWNNYYQQTERQFPSRFARFIVDGAWLTDTDILLDLGCGDGRDSVLLSQHCKLVIAADSSVCGVSKVPLVPKVLPALVDASQIENSGVGQLPITALYMRFFLNTIDACTEKGILAWASKHNISRLFIETRSIHDPLFGCGKQLSSNEFITTHYRRFLSIEQIQASVTTFGYMVEYFDESYSFSPMGTDKPPLIRMICKLKIR